MTIGIVSLWHDAPELLGEWERLLAPGGWDRAILVDNASSPESARAYAESAERADFTVLCMGENDVVKGWNAGMNALDTDARVCMANDVIMLHPNWLQRVANCVMPGVLHGPFGRRFIDGTLYLDGSLIVYHALDWEALGGLDEGYAHPGYVSDVDICWRAQQAGMLLRITDRVVHHLGNYSTQVGRGQVHPTWAANRDRFLAKKAAANSGHAEAGSEDHAAL